MAESILKFKVDNQEYNAKIDRARQGLLAMEQACRKVGGTLEVVEKEDLDFVKALGQMSTASNTAKGKVSELTKAFTDLQSQYNRLTSEEKSSPFGKALAQSLDQLKGRIQDGNKELQDIQNQLRGTTNEADTLADKFGINIGQMAKFATAGAAVAGALKVAKDAFFQTETGIDDWGRAVEASKGAYRVFLDTLNNGNWSNFFTNLNDAINGSIDLYNALDRLGSIKANNSVAIATEEKALAEARLKLQQAKTESEKKQLQSLIQEHTSKLSQLRQQESDAAKKAGQVDMTNTIRNGARSTYQDVSYGEIQSAILDIKKNGQAAMDKYAKQYAQLKTAGTTADRTESYQSATGQTYERTIKGTFDINKLTDAQKRQYAIAKAVTEGETRIQQGLATYAQGISAETNTMNEQFRYNRQSGIYKGTGGKGTSPTTTETYTPAVGSIDEMQAKVKELNKQFNATADQSVRDNLKAQIDECNKQLDIMRGKVEEVKPVEMQQGISLDTKAGLSAFKADQQKTINTASIGSEEYNMAVKLNVDATAMENILPMLSDITAQIPEQSREDFMRMAEAFKDTWLTEMAGGLDIPDEALQQLQDTINEQLAALDIDPIKIDVQTGGIKNLKKDAEQTVDHVAGIATAFNAVGNALNQIEDPGAKVAGYIATAIGQTAAAFGTAQTQAATMGPWAWIAFAATGLATMISTIQGIKSATAGSYADGGLIKGSSYTGDAVPIMANAGEIVLNYAQQSNIASALESKSASGGGGRSTISGEQIVTVVNAYGRRTGRGEILR